MSARWIVLAVVSSALVLVCGPEDPARAQTSGEACDVVDVEYALTARMILTDTPLGKGDGTHDIGPGSTVIRYDTRTGRAQMLDYRMTERFTVKATALFWTTTVVTDTQTHVAPPPPCGAAAEGIRVGRVVRWTTPVAGWATDGTMTCDGSLCGTFGAPPAGRSELHIAPHAVKLSPFELSADGTTFKMPYTQVSHSDSPQQTAQLALAGREMKRTCARIAICK